MSLAVRDSDLAPRWTFSCPDWWERLQDGRSLIPELPLDADRAEKGLRIFEKLRVPDIDNKPTLGEACGPWFKDIVRTVFGSVDDEGVRHVPEIFALVGKKNSKTTYSGGMILALLLANRTPRAEMLFVGPTQEIADAAFQQVVGMIEEDEEGYLQKRARCSGMWAWEGARKDTMEDILRSIGAEIRLTAEGKIWFELIDDDPAPEIAFTPRDFPDFDWVCGPEAVERPNICRIKYYSPERNFEMADIDLTGIAWSRIEDEVTRYGPKYFDVELPFCPSASQAQRIGRRLFLLARGESGVAVTNMAGLAAWGRYYGTVELPDLGDVEKVRFAPPRVDDARGMVEIPFAIWPDLPAWNPETDEAAAPEPIPDLAYEGGLPQPDPPSAALQITYPGGGKELRIAYSLPGGPGSIDEIEATYRSYSGALPGPWASMTEKWTFAYAAADVEGDQVDGRVRIFFGDDGSPYSAVLNTIVVVDNTACGVPALISGGGSVGDFDVALLNVTVAASELRAAAIQLERRSKSGSDPYGPWEYISMQNVRPEENLVFTDAHVPSGVPGSTGRSVQWQLITRTSDGTLGPPSAPITVNIPAD